MEISTIDVADEATATRLLEIHRAAQAADHPDTPAPCGVAFPARLRLPLPAAFMSHRVARVDGEIVAHLAVEFPTKDNRHLAFPEITVHPDYRRRGIGRQLLSVAEQLARDEDRRTLMADTYVAGDWEGAPQRSDAGRLFLEAAGFKFALKEITRRGPLKKLAEFQSEYDAAVAASTQYETIAWSGRVPEDLLAPLAKLNSTFITEAPMGDLELEEEELDAERMRTQDDRSVACGLYMCGVVARPIGSTELVANTVMAVATEPGDIAGQWITLVSPQHRGHRLGLRLKLENHEQLLRARPQVRFIDTGNADGNDHMISINELLGFQPVGYEYGYQREL